MSTNIWKTVSWLDLNEVISGIHPEYPQVFLKTNWIQDKNGFRLHENVERQDNTKKINPRIIGKILFKPNKKFKGKYLASEGLICKGTPNCSIINTACKAKIKIYYKVDHNVDIVVIESNHGENFFPPPNRKLPHFIRTKIREEDQIVKSMGKVGIKPLDKFLELSKVNEKSKDSFLPSKKVIENLLYYTRKGKDTLDPIEDLDTVVKSISSVIFPIKLEDYPTASFDGRHTFP